MSWTLHNLSYVSKYRLVNCFCDYWSHLNIYLYVCEKLYNMTWCVFHWTLVSSCSLSNFYRKVKWCLEKCDLIMASELAFTKQVTERVGIFLLPELKSWVSRIWKQTRAMVWRYESCSFSCSEMGRRDRRVCSSTLIWSRRALEAPFVDLQECKVWAIHICSSPISKPIKYVSS